MLPFLLRPSRTMYNASTLYTGTGGSQTLSTGVDASSGVMIFADREAVDAALVFGDDPTVAVRLGGVDATWSSLEYAALSGLTVNTASVDLTSAFRYNTNTNTYAAWSIRGGRDCEVVTWTGNGSTVAVSHSLGTASVIAIVAQYPSGPTFAPDAVYFFTYGASTDHALTKGAFQGTDVFNTSDTSSVTFEGAFSTSGKSYKAVLFPASSSTLATGSWAGFGTKSIGFRPKFVIGHYNDGGLVSWDDVRDGGGGSNNSADESTSLYDTASGTNTGSIITGQAGGISYGTNNTMHYLAFR